MLHMLSSLDIRLKELNNQVIEKQAINDSLNENLMRLQAELKIYKDKVNI